MISVIIPTYNCAAYLDDCLHSVFGQSYRDFEVIVIDDGSTDNTREVLGSWSGKITLIQQSNSGVAAARNAGLRCATGDLVAFLDADDTWTPEKLALQTAQLQSHPEVGLACSDFAIAEFDGSITQSYFRRRNPVEGGRVFERLVRDCFVFTSSVMMRRDLLDEVGQFDESAPYCDDYNMWLRAAHHADIGIIPTPLVTKRQRRGNQRSFESTACSLVAALQNLFVQLPDLPSDSRRAVTSEIDRLERAIGTYLLVNGKGDAARQHLRRVKTSPSTCVLRALTYAPPAAVQAVRRVRRLVRQPLPIQG